MPKYKYQAVTGAGKRIRGQAVAIDETDLFQKLKSEGMYLVSAREVVPRQQGTRLKADALAVFCRSLGTLLEAGAPLMRALGFLTDEGGISPGERRVYADLQRLIRQGMSLSEAMVQQGAFPPMIIKMFQAAEASGHLGLTAKRMAVYYEKEHRLNMKIKSSTAYSRFLLILIVAVVAILVGYVLPQFESLFEMVDELPLPTRILYGITDFISIWWLALIPAVLAAMLLVRIICKAEPLRLSLDQAKLHIPVMGKLLQTIYTARFARTLSSLYTSGIPIVSAIQIARGTVGNTWIERQIDLAVPVLRGGISLSESISQITGFAPKLGFSIKIGEETGSLDQMLSSVADDLEYEFEDAINKMTSLLEPMLIIVMALIVGFIMIAVMMPIYASYSAIGMDI